MLNQRTNKVTKIPTLIVLLIVLLSTFSNAGDLATVKRAVDGDTLLLTNQVVTFEELLMSQVVQQEALTRMLVEKGIFTKDEFLEMVKVVNQEMKIKKG